MAVYPTMRQGVRGAVTPAQLSRNKPAPYGQEYAGPSLQKYTFERETADYIADGSLYKIEMQHNIHTPFYVYSVVKTDNNAGVVVEFEHYGDDTLTLWFTDDSLSLAITIIG